MLQLCQSYEMAGKKCLVGKDFMTYFCVVSFIYFHLFF
jgi:hypothetical protein